MNGQQRLLKIRWVGRSVHVSCLCGWEGEPANSLQGAKSTHAEHVKNDCPIGKRSSGSN